MYADRQKDELNRRARSMGFPSYDAMIAFQRHREESLRQPSGGHDYGPADAKSAMALHPSVLLEYLRQKISKATGGQ